MQVRQIISIMMATAVSIHAQQIRQLKMTTPCLYLTQGYVLESISGKGFSQSTGSHISNIGGGNPASTYDFKELSFGISFQAESSIKPAWIADINHERDREYLPQSLGLILPLNRFRIGFGMNQRYNSLCDYGKITVVSIDHPEGYVETATVSKSEMTTAYSALLSYSFENAFVRNGRLSLGIQCSYNQLEIEQKLVFRMKVDAGHIGWTYGARYQISDRFQTGVYYERNPSFRDKIELDIDGNNDSIDADLITDMHLEGRLPDRLHAGLSYQLNSSVKASFDITKVYWSQLLDNSTNNVDISGSLCYRPAKRLSLSAGILSTDRRYDQETSAFFGINGRLHGLFLLGGLNLNFQHVDLDLAYVTSTIGSGEWRKQRLGKAGIGIYI